MLVLIESVMRARSMVEIASVVIFVGTHSQTVLGVLERSRRGERGVKNGKLVRCVHAMMP